MTEPNVGSGGNVVATLRMLVPQAAMAAYEKARLAAFPEDAAGQALPDVPIGWASDAPDIVSVDETGAVSAGEFGTAHITASAGSLTAVTTLTVTRAGVSGLQVEPERTSISIGERLELGVVVADQTGSSKMPRIVIWASSDPSIASVSPFGRVHPVAPGKAEISARNSDHTASASITVIPAKVAQVSLAPLTLNIEPGAEAQLKALASTQRGTLLPDLVIAWQSSDAQVASVDANGTVRGLRIGIAKITASCGGVRAVTTVRVMARKPSTRP